MDIKAIAKEKPVQLSYVKLAPGITITVQGEKADTFSADLGFELWAHTRPTTGDGYVTIKLINDPEKEVRQEFHFVEEQDVDFVKELE